MAWQAPTYKTANNLPDNPTVTCSCGRRTSADMLLDLRGLPPGMKDKLVPNRPDFACDACLSRADHRGTLRRKDLAKALGAPASLAAKISEQPTE